MKKFDLDTVIELGLTALLVIWIVWMVLFATSALAETTIYLSDGTSVTTEDKVYVSSEPLYRVTGDLDSTLGVTLAEELKAVTEPLTDPCTGLTFGGLPEGCIEPEPEPEECNPFTFGGGSGC